MSQEDINTPAPEVIEPETTVQTEQASTEPTVAETFGEKVQDKKPEVVPMARLNKEINRRKEFEKRVVELERQLADGDISKNEMSTDLKALAEEHNIDAGFLDKLVKTIKSQSEADIDERLRPLTEREAREKRDKAFSEHFGKALESFSEIKDVVNPEVIKQMAFNPANANKTFTQLIEEAYGNVAQGKRTLEPTTPRGGYKEGPVDVDRARKDTEYFKEIMANPQTKAEYNQRLHERVRL